MNIKRLTIIFISAVTLFFGANSFASIENWKKKPDLAQYKWASPGNKWDNEVLRVHYLSPEQAVEIAEQLPEVTFFTYIKGGQMCLEGEDGTMANGKGCFVYGDVIFFKGKDWLGTAPGLADTYIKQPTTDKETAYRV